MKLNVLTVLNDIDGNPLKIGQDVRDAEGNVTQASPTMVLADVLINVALSPAPPNKPYSPKQHVIRYELALNANKARKLEPPVIEVSAEMAAEVKDDLARIYMPIVAGQVLPMLDGK